MVRILLDDLLQAPSVGVLCPFFVQMNQDIGAGRGARVGFFRLFDLEAGLAVGDPLPSGIFSGLARKHLDFVGDHKNGIKADTKLSDEVGILPGIAGELRQKALGPGARDSAEVRDEVLLVHSDAGVADRKSLLLFLKG